MNILVTGANGQLGSEIKYLVTNNHLPSNIRHLKFFFTDKDNLDITNKNKIKEYIENNNIKIIKNCAAYTAVDKAEEEKELAELINYKAVENLAKISKKKMYF